MVRLAALVVVGCALVSVPFALAQTEGNTTQADAQAPPTTTPTADPQAAVPSCTPLKVIYNHRRWRVSHPGRGFNACAGDVKKWKASWALWRRYRLVAPYSGFKNEGDPYLKWLAIPASIVSCETNGYRGEGRWLARNSSGAQGPAQLLGWPAPNPARTPAEKVRYWEVTAQVWHGSGSGAWACA